MVASGELKAPIVIGRDHLDCGSVASPNRETEAMRDGSDAVSDWPLLNALLNCASGATWVSLHHGGGVGMGFSQHAGMVIVADGTPEAARRLERVLCNDPAAASCAMPTPVTKSPLNAHAATGSICPVWRYSTREAGATPNMRRRSLRLISPLDGDGPLPQSPSARHSGYTVRHTSGARGQRGESGISAGGLAADGISPTMRCI